MNWRGIIDWFDGWCPRETLLRFYAHEKTSRKNGFLNLFTEVYPFVLCVALLASGIFFASYSNEGGGGRTGGNQLFLVSPDEPLTLKVSVYERADVSYRPWLQEENFAWIYYEPPAITFTRVIRHKLDYMISSNQTATFIAELYGPSINASSFPQNLNPSPLGWEGSGGAYILPQNGTYNFVVKNLGPTENIYEVKFTLESTWIYFPHRYEGILLIILSLIYPMIVFGKKMRELEP